MDKLPQSIIEQAVRAALAEDVGAGDVTTNATVPESALAIGRIVAREPVTVAGLGLAEEAFRQISTSVELLRKVADGARAERGATLLQVKGPARAILTAERVALNFLQRMSGIATLTASFVAAVAGCPVEILDTRKTTPGWRRLEKYAVKCGGGRNHRFGLFDLILIKDNHLFALRTESDPVRTAVERARHAFPGLQVEVEADHLEQVRQAVNAGADIILLDNMSLAELREAASVVGGRAKTEASGGVNLQTVRAIAETGVNYISVGALTHSARAVDVALDFTSD